MPAKMELYIRTIEHVQRDTEPTEHMKEAHTHTILGWEDRKLITSIHRWLPENEVAVKEMVEEFARRHGLALVTYDLCGLWARLRARARGIGKTPAVVIGKLIFGPTISVDRLEGALEWK